MHAPAIDRYLARGLSKSVCVNTRKKREICLKMATSGETLAKARFDIDGANRSSAAKWRKTNRTIWYLVPPSFPHFQEKTNDWRNRARVLLDLFSNFKRARSSAYFRLTSRASDSSAWTILGKEKIDNEA